MVELELFSESCYKVETNTTPTDLNAYQQNLHILNAVCLKCMYEYEA